MKRSSGIIILTVLIICAVTPLQPNAQPLALNLVDTSRLSYKDYVFSKYYDSSGKKLVIKITQNGNEVFRDYYEEIERLDLVRFGLIPLLNKETSQLVIEQGNGGNGCSADYKIFDLYPTFRNIYDSEANGCMGFEDIDNDGYVELEEQIFTYGAGELCRANSAGGTAIFKFDKDTYKYRPANRLLASYALRSIQDDIKKLRDIGARVDHVSTPEDAAYSTYTDYLSKTIQIVITMIYAGEYRQAWDFFDREYKLSNRATIKATLMDELRSPLDSKSKDSEIFRYLYGSELQSDTSSTNPTPTSQPPSATPTTQTTSMFETLKDRLVSGLPSVFWYGLGFIVLVGIVLGMTDMAVFYMDLKDLVISFIPLLIFVIALLFLDQPGISKVIALGVAAVGLIVVAYNSFKYNNNKLVAVIIAIARLCLAFLGVFAVLHVLLGHILLNKKNVLARILIYVLYILVGIVAFVMRRLINGDRVLGKKETAEAIA